MRLPSITIPKLHLSVTRWWLVSLSCIFIAAIVIAAHALFLFVQAFQAGSATDDTNAAVESISREALTERVEAFKARARRFETIRAQHGETSPAVPTAPAPPTAPDTTETPAE